MSKTLVAYFSASGTTARKAKDLADAIDADLYEIKPETPYSRADLNWHEQNSRSTIEMSNKSFRPPLADHDAKIDEYETIFVGFPIWWHVAPTIVNTFLESYDFSGKKIIPFATSGGSGMGKTVSELKPSAKGAEFAAGGLLNGRQSADTLQAFAKNNRVRHKSAPF